MKKILFIITTLAVLAATNVHAQEQLFPLKYNPNLLYNHSPNNNSFEKGFKRTYDRLCEGQRGIELLETTYPSCNQADGKITILLNNIPENSTYTLTLNGTVVAGVATAIGNGTQIELDALSANAYFINVLDDNNNTFSTAVELNNDSIEPIDRAGFFSQNAFCNQSGRLLRTAFDVLVRQHTLYNQNGQLLQNLPNNFSFINLAQGTYYLRAEDEDVGCYTYYIFSIGEDYTLSLPFIEDFSNAEDTHTQVWQDPDAFINTTYPINPVGLGVATLDGLDYLGRPYQDPTTSGSTLNLIYGDGDYLTSRPFCLSTLSTDVDSVYLKFFYQPQGLGDYPNLNDSLVVDILPAFSNWKRVWHIRGFNTTQSNHPFVPVIIAIDADLVRYDGFQIRFHNKATVSGNNDHWHIDYVMLDTERGTFPILNNDAAFTYQAPSMLNFYTAMPWKHFIANPQAHLAPLNKFRLAVQSNGNATTSRLLNHQIREVCTEALIYDNEIGAAPLSNGSTLTAIPQQPTEVINIFEPSPIAEAIEDAENTGILNADSLVLENRWTLYNSTGSDFNSNNDTLYQYQQFFNYFAYDDGTAERAYGLFGTSAQLAYRFVLSTSDILRALQIQFITMNTDMSNYDFSIQVWKNIKPNTASATLIYNGATANMPQYIDQRNSFFTYLLDEPLSLNANDTIYIGITQTNQDILNFGFDLNNNASNQLFVNYNGLWEPSIWEGALMMRPIFGDLLPDNVNVSTDQPTLFPAQNAAFRLYPNPAYEQVFLKTTATQPAIQHVQILNSLGVVVQQKAYQGGGIAISDLPIGLYIVRAYDSSNKLIGTQKFVKAQ